MNAWKLIVYPIGLALIAIVAADLAGIAAFGADSRLWMQWQNQAVSTLGTVAGIAGIIGGLYLAHRSHVWPSHWSTIYSPKASKLRR